MKIKPDTLGWNPCTILISSIALGKLHHLFEPHFLYPLNEDNNITCLLYEVNWFTTVPSEHSNISACYQYHQHQLCGSLPLNFFLVYI